MGRGGVRGYFTDYRSALEARGDDWTYEANFICALDSLLDGHQPDLAPDSPYEPAARRAHNEHDQILKLRSVGGNLSVTDLKELLDSATQHLRARQKFIDAMTSGMPDDTEARVKFLGERFEDPQLHRNSRAQNQWEHELFAWRDDLMRRRHTWQHEVELVDALIALVKSAPAERLSPDNPYIEIMRDISATVPQLPEMPVDQTIAALALGEDEFIEHYMHGLIAGPSRDLDRILACTVLARTTAPDQHEYIMGELRTRSAALPTDSALAPQRELLDALARILRDEDPNLPPGHRYKTECLRVKHSIDLFHGDLTWPGSLPGEEIKRLVVITAGVLTLHRAHFKDWQERLSRLTAEHADKAPTTEKLRTSCALWTFC
jgi:hypothetical protein